MLIKVWALNSSNLQIYPKKSSSSVFASPQDGKSDEELKQELLTIDQLLGGSGSEFIEGRTLQEILNGVLSNAMNYWTLEDAASRTEHLAGFEHSGQAYEDLVTFVEENNFKVPNKCQRPWANLKNFLSKSKS